jgi:hypothetical protein
MTKGKAVHEYDRPVTGTAYSTLPVFSVFPVVRAWNQH